jgi:predicted metal-dependent HD superfamily phosphohydrolase
LHREKPQPGETTLLFRWQSVWQELGAADADEELFRQLVASYSEPHRKYHTMQHLQECFAHLETVRSYAERPGEVELALWFHDAIYDTQRKDNETRSAEWARDSALAGGLSSEQAHRIYELIVVTMHDAVPAGRDAAVLVDVDLSILGADAARFDEYELQIREEYAWVPEALYRKARRQILREFLNRERIYSTEYFQYQYEARARENIARSLVRL